MLNLNAEAILKMAENNEDVKQAVINLAKVAADESEFDESVPAVDEKNNEKDNNNKEPKKAVPVKEQQQQIEVPQEEVAAPVAPVAPAGPSSPEESGARAAQAFIGPEIMAAAVSGDPGAQDVISRTAGQVAGAVAEASARAFAMSAGLAAEAQGVPESAEGIPAEGMAQEVPMTPAAPAAPVSSEEQVADQIVPEGVPAATPEAPMTPQGASAAVPAAIPSQDTYTAEEVAALLKQLGVKKPPIAA